MSRWPLLLIFLIGCTTPPPASLSTNPIPNDREKIFKICLAILVQEGYTIAYADPENGIINTEWKPVLLSGGEKILAGMFLKGHESQTKITIILDANNQLTFQPLKRYKDQTTYYSWETLNAIWPADRELLNKMLLALGQPALPIE